MGNYLNPGNSGFTAIRAGTYVDKSGLISLINGTIGTSRKMTLISRPRRFGKSFAAKMLCAYYDNSCDSANLFQDLAISTDPSYKRHINRYNVIYLDMTGFLGNAGTTPLPDYLKEVLLSEVIDRWPNLNRNKSLSDILADAAEEYGSFIAVIDEWDAPVREKPECIREYLGFLRTLFKNSTTDKTFAAVYMTGILPIKKDGSQSALSDFREYTMLSPGPFAPYIGFLDEEVRSLCHEYSMDFEQMKYWYDGYAFEGIGEIYNPNSVIEAVTRKKLDSYWRQTSTANNLLQFISLDFDGLQKAVAELLGGVDIPVSTGAFQNDIRILRSKDDALTLLIHLGYLSYNEETETAHIPNEEIRLEFSSMIRDVKHEETIRRVKESDQLIEDTVMMRADRVAVQIEKIHDEETSPLFYNNEQALRSVIKLAYFSYKDQYVKFEELPAGKGYADVIYLPKKRSPYPALLIELKWNQCTEGAITQIKERHYPESLKDYGGEVLLVGIGYDAKSKKHTCLIERFQ